MSVKTIIWDVETSPIVAYTWGLYGHDIQPGNIITDRGILCICWKTLGERTVHSVSIGPDCSERKLIETFRAAIDDADILVAHNGDKFDLKHLTAKLIEYDITPLHKVNTVDTLKEVKKVAKFSSNRLDFLCGKLFGAKKHETDMQLWKDCMAGDAAAMRRMVAYCKNDVVLLERLYTTLRPYMKTHPNVADTDSMNCPRCNSDMARLRKAYRTKTGLERAHLHCIACSAPYTIAATKINRPLSAV